MIVVSLVLNIVVLVAVCGSLIVNAAWTDSAYGARTPARDILLAIYLAILIGSAALIVANLMTPMPSVLGATAALLGLQVVYKGLSAATVRQSLRNPVVLSNLAIAVVHSITVVTMIPMLQ